MKKEQGKFKDGEENGREKESDRRREREVERERERFEYNRIEKENKAKQCKVNKINK